MKRIYWIDWAKAVAVTTVVFCHLPQSQEWFYFRYLQTCIITIFFFLSGYLKRDRGSALANWQKYSRSLLLPYVAYNVVFMPYWIARFIMQNGAAPDFASVMRPIVGTLLLQHEGAFSEPLNGPLWYLPAILLMHVILDLCLKTRHPHRMMSGLCMLSIALYYAYRYFELPSSLTPVGFIRRLPFFYLGYVMANKWNGWETGPRLGGMLRRHRAAVYLLTATAFLSASLLLFHWHINAHSLLPHLLLFYLVCLLFLPGVLFACKAIESRTPAFVVTLSIGTIVVIGLHWMVIGIFNYFFFDSFSTLYGDMRYYEWDKALAIALAITALHYPLISYALRKHPWLLGR